MSGAPIYKAEDRSILLPFYKRFLMDPFVPWIPARIHPNTITHIGHALNAAAMALLLVLKPTKGWAFIAAAVLMHLYCWCDNADGAHARRTKQTSALGEFLDHGLDILNTVYIGVMSAVVLDASPAFTIALVLIIPAASAVTYWEQAETGVFRLGMLNQIESIFVVALCMIATAFLGTGIWQKYTLGPVSAYLFILCWPISTMLFGLARNVVRVQRTGRPIAPAMVFIALQLCVFFAGYRGFTSVLVACAFATAANLYFGITMLVTRLRGLIPRLDGVLVVGLLAMVGFLAYCSLGLRLADPFGVVAPVAVVCLVGARVIAHTRLGVQFLARVEGAR